MLRVDYVSEVNSHAMSNEAYVSDAAIVTAGNRSSMDGDITLCENILYAPRSQSPLAAGSPPPHDVANAHGICFIYWLSSVLLYSTPTSGLLQVYAVCSDRIGLSQAER